MTEPHPDPRDPVALAQALVRCPTITPDAGAALDVMERALRAAGFAVERPAFGEGAARVENLIARRGAGAPVMALAGHVDVVPPGDAAAWARPPFSGAIEDGHLHGRGAEDMKGGLAALVAAAARFAQARPDHAGTILFLVAGDEEGPAINGTARLVAAMRARGERFDACLLAEPTATKRFGDAMKIGRRGSLTVDLAVTGRQGHVAYPERALNPIPLMARVLTALTDAPLDAGTAHFGPSTLEATTVDVGNPADNVVPGRAAATLNARFNDAWTHASLEAELRCRAGTVAMPEGAALALTARPSNSPSFLTAPGPFTDLVARAVEAVTGERPSLSTAGGTSDARFLKDLGPVVELGVTGRTMHQVDESASVEEITALSRAAEAVIAGVLGGALGPAGSESRAAS